MTVPSFSHNALARAIGLAIMLTLVLFGAQNSHWTVSARRAPAVRNLPALGGVFYTVTGTADNTDAVIHGGTGSAGNPFQMSSLRGAILNGNTVVTSSVGPVTIFLPAGTYQLSVSNPNTPASTGTIAFPDLEIGSSFNHETSVIGTGGNPKIQQTVGGNDVITTGFQSDGFTPQAVTLTLQNLEITGGSFSGIFTGVDNASGRSVTTITNCNVHDNSDPFGPGGAIFNQTGNLTISGSTFANNTASDQGGAIFYDLPNSDGSPGTFGNFIVTNSTFTNNSATANNNVAGGAIAFFGPDKVENTYSITGTNFVNNQAGGANATGGAIGSASIGTLHATLNRFFGNTSTGGGSAVGAQGATPIDAINNWWGCDGLPSSTGCDTAAGTGVSSDPRIDLVVTAAPGCASTTVTADFTHNSAGQPISPTVLNGLTVNFLVVSGPPGSLVNPASAAISGFTASTSLTATSGGAATVAASLDNGMDTVSTQIDQAVAVTANPTDQSACDGATVSFTATASGNPAPTVQWQVSTNGGGSFINIPGATSPTLSFSVTAAQNGNQYRAVFSNSCDSTTNTATTTAATLTVTEPPTVSTNPTNQTTCEGAPVSFTAAATGSPSVQWQVSTNGGATFSNIPGATNTTLTFNATASQNGNQYRAVFTNSCGSATTAAATLNVNPATTATVPADQTVCQGAPANFSTTAGGTGPFHYAWTVDGSPFNGDSASISVPTGPMTVGNHSVSVTVSGSCGSVTKNATLTVQANTSTTKPNDETVCQGSTASFSTTASGTGPFTFGWRKGATVLHTGDFGGRVTITSSSNSSTLIISNVQPGDADAYSVDTSGTCGTATQSANLTVGSSTPTITLNGQTPTLWPPNHAYQSFNVSDFVASAHDDCDATVNLGSVYITMVTSDEAENGPGSGNTLNDIVISSDCKSIQLRAERDGSSDGRVYTIYFKVRNAIGNFTTASAKVVVPANPGQTPVDSGPHYTVNSNCP